jgi:3-hydroxybutyryl-CoA dehydratase
MKVGDRAETARTYRREDAQAFAALAGLSGPATEAVPEPLVNALFSYLLGVELPGAGTNYLKQETQYLARAPYDEELTASVEVTRLRPAKHLVDLETVCRRPDGEIVARGRALVFVRDRVAAT